ncbi:MAG: hypothetical protein IT445_18625 [Phycisphaeraceae bacterium]|nr:hypothetical protein [Phycisphaeraceae bacterium]
MNLLLLLAQQTQQGASTSAASGGGGGDITLMVAVILMIAAIGIFVVEVMVPSGGVLGMLSACCLVVGVVMLCLVNLTWGLVVALVALIALPFAIGGGLRIWPDTPIGRWLTMSEQQKAHFDSQKEAAADPRVGVEGVAITDLRPIGSCMINGKREECSAAQGLIEKGAKVRVVAVDGMQLRVEAVEG